MCIVYLHLLSDALGKSTKILFNFSIWVEYRKEYRIANTNIHIYCFI